jgi:phosphinothricin acetyltransferase
MELELFEADVDDAAEISALFGHYVARTVATFEVEAPSPADWRDKIATLRGAGLPFLVARTDGRLAGFANVSPWRPKPAYRHTVEDTIYLSPEHIGCGYGRRLLARLLEAAESAGARQVIAVISDTGDPTSTRLHRAAGFEQVGILRQVGHKHGRWIDTALLQLDLSAPRTG